MRYIDRYPAILLDMGRTFMFDVDRFGPDHDYHLTYLDLGGKSLDSAKLRTIIDKLYKLMLSAGHDPASYDNFGSVQFYLQKVREASHLDRAEREIVENTFARHEVGTIPESYALVLKQLRETHLLGIVSNVWAAEEIFEQELRRADVLHCFDVLIWSSEHGCIKPSPRLFQLALDQLRLAPAEVLFVGNDLHRDIWGAKNLGMATVWITDENPDDLTTGSQPEAIVADLHELLTLERAAHSRT